MLPLCPLTGEEATGAGLILGQNAGAIGMPIICVAPALVQAPYEGVRRREQAILGGEHGTKGIVPSVSHDYFGRARVKNPESMPSLCPSENMYEAGTILSTQLNYEVNPENSTT